MSDNDNDEKKKKIKDDKEWEELTSNQKQAAFPQWPSEDYPI